MWKNMYLYTVVFLGGGIVLALEILGTRVLGPFYGVSIYLWSALISVTLFGLTIGYLIGGKLADSRPEVSILAVILGIAGIWVITIPLLRHPILNMLEPFGLRAAVLIATTVLFLPPFMLLGTISPIAIRIKTTTVDNVGSIAGTLYALSTLASVLAALATGFVLIPKFGVSNLLFSIGIILLLISALGFILEGRKTPIVISIFFILLGAGAWKGNAGETAHPGEGLISIQQSRYGELRVVDLKGTRHLLFDGSLHAQVDTTNWRSVFPYVSVMELPKYIIPKPGSMLLIGLGAGSLAKSYHADGWKVDAVEIDPVILDLARKDFHLMPEDAAIQIDDGRHFLEHSQKQYDVILIDAFGSGSIPFHLITGEVFVLFRDHLAPHGVLALNTEALGWNDIVVRSIAATLETAFPTVAAIPIAEPPSEFGNVVLLAASTTLTLTQDLPRTYLDPDYRFSGNYWKVHGWDNSFTPKTQNVPILTDECNPMDVWSEDINYASRQEIHKYFAGFGYSW